MQRSTAGSLARSLVSGLSLLLLLVPSGAQGQPQTNDQRACTNTMNQALARVSTTVASEIASCVRDGSKGKALPGSTIEGCSIADAKAKLAKARAKTATDFTKKCTGTSRKPAGAPKKPAYGVTDADTVNEAAALVYDLFHDELGAVLDVGVIREASDKTAARCQQFVTRDVRACHATLIGELNKCKQAGLARKVGGFDDPSDLESCFAADPKGMIAKRCDRLRQIRPGRFELDSIRKSLRESCVAKGVSLAQAVPGCATADAEAAHACLERAAVCRACLAIDSSDGLALDCDVLDDGLSNSSCVGPIGRHACALDPDSSFFFESRAGFLGGSIGGSVNVDCGTVDVATGTAPCTCALGNATPIEVPGTGWACFTAVDACPSGEVACTGGDSLDFSIAADHNLGACTSNAACAAQCGTSCTASGAEVWDSGCEGFCEGGSANGGACTTNAQCPGGRCNGVAGGGHGNVCQCQCIDLVGAASSAGGLRCHLGLGVRIESALPCDGTDVVLDIGNRCLPLTTESAQASLVDQDNVAGRMLPSGTDVLGGQAIACSALRAGNLTGMGLVSAANAFDIPAAGDVYLLFALACE